MSNTIKIIIACVGAVVLYMLYSVFLSRSDTPTQVVMTNGYIDTQSAQSDTLAQSELIDDQTQSTTIDRQKR